VEKTEEYKKKVIVYDAEADPPRLSINDHPVQVRRNPSGKWWTPDAAFREFGSLEELARAVADTLPE
jgi:hypothetical protein